MNSYGTSVIKSSMSPMEAYLLITYIKPALGLSKETVHEMILKEGKFKAYPSYADLVADFTRRPPTTTQIVQALETLLGVSPTNIAEHLDISKQTVSYHRSRTGQEEYKNHYFEGYKHR